MDRNATTTDQYWATTDPEELAAHLCNKIDQYYTWVNGTGRRYLWSTAYNTYNAALINGPDINNAGAEGEYHLVSVNQTRNIVKHLMNLTVSQRPAFEPRSTNTDSKSQKQAVIARSLLQYYLREKNLEDRIRGALEFATLYGEGFVTVTWDTTDGEILGTDDETGIDVKEGDVCYDTYEPMDVVRDVALNSSADSTWNIVRKYRNRWDVVAEFPEHRDAILAVPTTRDLTRSFDFNRMSFAVETDLIEVFEFFHKRTAAVPKGRYALFLYDGGPLLVSSLPYRDMPVYRLSADDISGQPFGYGTIFDLLNIQQAVDAAYSSIQTNQATFGVQSIAVPKGSNLSSTQVSGGLNLVEYDAGPGGGKPEVLQFLATAPEMFNHLGKLESVMETLGGINSVIRGDPPYAGMSGAAMALLQSQAVQFVQGLQSSYVKCLEGTGTGTIATLRDYATTKRVVAIVGKTNRSNLQEFTGDDLSTVNRVQVDVGNPLTRTTAGKLEIAQMLLTAGMIKNPIELLGVIETGNLDTMTEGPQNELMSIKAENEVLADGGAVSAVVLDNHKLHLVEHATIMSDPAVRGDAERTAAVMQHIQEHWALWSDPANAGILAALGQEPAPQAPSGPGPSAMPGPGPEGIQGAVPSPDLNDPNGMADSMSPNMPNLPQGAIPVEGAAVQ